MAQQTLDPSGSADCKIYALVVFGRLLQAGAVVAAISTLFAVAILGPVGLVGVVVTIALGVLGTYVANHDEGIFHPTPALPPYVQGQPVGLANGSNNCWLNAAIQLLINSPGLLNTPGAQRNLQVRQFAEAYLVAQSEGERVARYANSQQIRSSLHAIGRVGGMNTQEDPAQFFEYLFEAPYSLYRLQMTIGGLLTDTSRAEHLLSVEVGEDIGYDFNEMLFNYFNYQDDLGREINLKFSTSPDQLLIQLKRFYQRLDPDSHQVVFGKKEVAISMPMDATLPEGYSQDSRPASYECNGFIVHFSHTLNSGHFVTFIKKADNTWWACNDRDIEQVNLERVQMLMNLGYIYFYQRVY